MLHACTTSPVRALQPMDPCAHASMQRARLSVRNKCLSTYMLDEAQQVPLYMKSSSCQAPSFACGSSSCQAPSFACGPCAGCHLVFLMWGGFFRGNETATPRREKQIQPTEYGTGYPDRCRNGQARYSYVCMSPRCLCRKSRSISPCVRPGV